MTDTLQNQYAPTVVSAPGETLAELLGERDMTQRSLAQRMGRTPKTINEIIKGKAPITPETAIQLERVLGVPAEFWDARERVFRAYHARVEEQQKLKRYVPWLKEIPWSKMASHGWVARHPSRVDQVREMLDFFGVASPDQWRELCTEKEASYRRSMATSGDDAAISCWLRQGERESQTISCEPYRESDFRRALREIRALTRRQPEEYAPTMVKRCAEAGVALVFVRELPKVPVSGACRWLSPTKALIQLSLRYKTDDQFWFSFFHEAAHVLLHGRKEVFLDSLQATQGSRKLEAEADRFAANFLILPNQYIAFVARGRLSAESVIDFASDIDVAPGIVVGRLQHDGHLPFTHLNSLKQKLSWIDG